MRFVAVDWGTSRIRALLVDGQDVAERRDSDEGVSRLRSGEHAAAFGRLCGTWLSRQPDLPVLLVGMVGSREGWFLAPYARCPAGPAEIAAALLPVDLGGGGRGFVVPGLRTAAGDATDVMRGEETHLLGSGVVDGLVCLPGTHCKWARMEGGRITGFASFLTGEMHALLREHSMVGRPASEPPDPKGFALGLADAETGSSGGLLNELFRARASTIVGEIASDRLGPYLSGLLTGHEVAGALRLFGRPESVTVVADPPRADLYRQALARHGIGFTTVGQEETLLAGLGWIVQAAGSAIRSI